MNFKQMDRQATKRQRGRRIVKRKRWKNANGEKMKTKDIKRNCGKYKIEIKTQKGKWT